MNTMEYPTLPYPTLHSRHSFSEPFHLPLPILQARSMETLGARSTLPLLPLLPPILHGLYFSMHNPP